MFDNLYLIHLDEGDVWQLREFTSGLCISCGKGQDYIERCIYQVVLRYRTESKLIKKLNNMDSSINHLSHDEYARQMSLYKEQAEEHEDIVRRVVRQAYEVVKMDTPAIRNSKKAKRLPPKESSPAKVITLSSFRGANTPKKMGGMIVSNSFKRLKA